jgi:hypothetical protein
VRLRRKLRKKLRKKLVRLRRKPSNKRDRSDFGKFS